MFYSHLVLTKKGHLGKVWMAATLGESKISKTFATNAKIHSLCKTIEQPATPFALRLSSALMLGVVRVFNRKSTIILADVNAIMNALRRHRLLQTGRKSAQKRHRDAASAITADSRCISLQEEEDTVRFNLITLPDRKKQKTSASTSKNTHPVFNVNSAMSPPSVLREGTTHRSVLFADLSFGDTAEVDVLTAMETVFPSVVVPHVGDHLSSGSISSPNPSNGPSPERLLMYRAREQDITLPAPTDQLDNTGFELFEENLQVSLHSDPMSNAEISHGMWLQGMEDGHNLAESLGSSSNQLLKSHESEQEDVNNLNEHNQNTPLTIEPLQTESLEFQQPDEPAVAKSATKLSKKRTQIASVSVAPPASAEATRHFQTPQNNVAQMPVLATAPATTSSRKRKSAKLRIDPVTELSPSEIRNFLNDTTDIVRPIFEQRVSSSKKSRRKSQESNNNALPIPEYLNSFSKDITDLWRDVTARTFNSSTANADSEGPGSQPELVRDPRRRGAGTGRRPPRPQIRAHVDIPMEADQEDAPLVQQMPENEGPNSNSVEIDRGDELSKSRSNDQVSVPSRSQEGNYWSQSGQAGGAASSTASKRLAEIIDTITADDRKQYEDAVTSDKQKKGTSSGQHINLDNAGFRNISPQKLPMDDVLAESPDKGQVSPSTSDIPLLEETEKIAQLETPTSGPVSVISVRAFKMVEILRRLAHINEKSDKTKITTFDELVEGCSRGATARAFFNLLSLVNSRFVEVNQTEAYGPITVNAGTHF